MCEIAPDVPEIINGDSNRLRQVVVNLIGNAIRFTDEGEVARKVDVAFRKTNLCLLRFTVSDTGIGIAKDKLDIVFKPFSQADPLHHPEVWRYRPGINDLDAPGYVGGIWQGEKSTGLHVPYSRLDRQRDEGGTVKNIWPRVWAAI